MTYVEPDISDKAKYPIGEAAKLLGISRKTLFNHTRACMIKCGHTKHSGRKFYYGVELKKYWRMCL